MRRAQVSSRPTARSCLSSKKRLASTAFDGGTTHALLKRPRHQDEPPSHDALAVTSGLCSCDTDPPSDHFIIVNDVGSSPSGVRRLDDEIETKLGHMKRQCRSSRALTTRSSATASSTERSNSVTFTAPATPVSPPWTSTRPTSDVNTSAWWSIGNSADLTEKKSSGASADRLCLSIAWEEISKRTEDAWVEDRKLMSKAVHYLQAYCDQSTPQTPAKPASHTHSAASTSNEPSDRDVAGAILAIARQTEIAPRVGCAMLLLLFQHLAGSAGVEDVVTKLSPSQEELSVFPGAMFEQVVKACRDVIGKRVAEQLYMADRIIAECVSNASGTAEIWVECSQGHTLLAAREMAAIAAHVSAFAQRNSRMSEPLPYALDLQACEDSLGRLKRLAFDAAYAAREDFGMASSTPYHGAGSLIREFKAPELPAFTARDAKLNAAFQKIQQLTAATQVFVLEQGRELLFCRVLATLEEANKASKRGRKPTPRDTEAIELLLHVAELAKDAPQAACAALIICWQSAGLSDLYRDNAAFAVAAEEQATLGVPSVKNFYLSLDHSSDDTDVSRSYMYLGRRIVLQELKAAEERMTRCAASVEACQAELLFGRSNGGAGKAESVRQLICKVLELCEPLR